MLIEMVSYQMQKLRWSLLPCPDLEDGLVEVAQVCIQRSFNKLDDLTEFDIPTIETSHLIKSVYKFYQTNL